MSAPKASPTARPTTGWGFTVIAVLAVFYCLLLASVREKSLTADEIAHSTAGYSYWKFNDYRFNPENGNLPQRVIGLPLFLSNDIKYPATDSDEWRSTEIWLFGYDWYHRLGNDIPAMLFRGRAGIALLTVVLGGVVWAWSFRLFGPRGGLVSLLLFVLSPAILANGALMTSDAAAALFFLAAVWGIWAVLHRVTPGRLATSALLTAGLFISKASALLVVPIAITLMMARLARAEPLPVAIGTPREIATRGRKTLVFLGVAALHAVVVWSVIWASVGFRYSPFADSDVRNRHAESWESVLGRPDPLTLLDQLQLTPEQKVHEAEILRDVRLSKEPWAPERVEAMQKLRRDVLTPDQSRRLDALLGVPPTALTARLIDALRQHHVLPEAYLYGLAHASKHAGFRSAFLNGEVRLNGWRSFFPYTFFVKTPLSFFVIGILALAAAVTKFRRQGATAAQLRSGLYATLPLWTLLGFYWIAALSTSLNIGHRHILATYPPLFVLCGAAAYWWTSTSRALKFALGGALVALGGEVLSRYPNYLAYFNPLAGGPTHAYRHLVDSSLDWGQDLPSVSPYLTRHGVHEPVYLSYFGDGDPNSYGIRAHFLYSFGGRHVTPPLQLKPFPADQANARVEEELRREPDYEIAGSSRGPNNTIGVLFLKKPEALRLSAGTYLISATMLQPVMYQIDGPLGPWNPRFEKIYQELAATAKPLLSANPSVRLAALRQHRASEWEALLPRYEMFRFARLTAWLRRREPDGNINYSILVYQLSESDLAAALDGPPPELGEDVPAKFGPGDGTAQLLRKP